MLRALIKTGTACVLHWTRTERLMGAAAQGAGDVPVVIAYHRVVEDFTSESTRCIPAMLISVRMLERHLDWIGRRFRVFSLDELALRLQRGEPFQGPAAAITFDDGYRDVYEYAFPLLKRKGMPAALFVVSDLVGTSKILPHDNLYYLLARALAKGYWRPESPARFFGRFGIPSTAWEGDREAPRTPFSLTRVLLETEPHAQLERMIQRLSSVIDDAHTSPPGKPLTWDMLARMQNAGMTIGSHTGTHPFLTNESPERVVDEVSRSREALEQRLGSTVRHFAYPSGLFNPAVVRAVASSGYEYGYTICVHRDRAHPLLTIPRKVLWENSCLDVTGRFSSALMSCQVHRSFDWMMRCQHGEKTLWTTQ